MTSVRTPTSRTTPPPPRSIWSTLQPIGVVAYSGLLVGLVVGPDLTLRLFWELAIPLVPLVLFINPLIWRNLCPLATLNTVANGRVSRRRVQGRWLRRSWYAGAGLLIAIIAARHLVLNDEPVWLAAFLGSLGVAAVPLGAVFEQRAGFCNSICPLLPVERFYGQRPLVVSDRVRCPACSACVSRGCIDLSPVEAGLRAAEALRAGRRWMWSAPGLFALSFPGVIAGYYAAEKLGIGGIWSTVGVLVAGGLVSASVSGAVVTARRVPPETAFAALALAAGILYYWFASETLAGWISGPVHERAVVVIRALFVLTLVVWYTRARNAVRNDALTGTAPRSPT